MEINVTTKEKNYISDYEISVIKTLFNNKANTQDICFKINIYRTLNAKSLINQGRITEITRENSEINKLRKRSKNLKPINDKELDLFNKIISNYNIHTLLSPFIEDHQLIIKARDSMMNAITNFNSPQKDFRIETFLVLSNISWVALLQSICNKNSIEIKKDNNHYDGILNLVEKVELSQAMKSNLSVLNELRNRIVHSPDNSIPNDVIQLIQANCLNFNKVIRKEYGEHRGIDYIFSTAIQLNTYDPLQIRQLANSDKNSLLEIIKKFEEIR